MNHYGMNAPMNFIKSGKINTTLNQNPPNPKTNKAMKPDILYAYEKARKVISSMTLKTSHTAWKYVMLFRKMFGMKNFYTEALRTAWSLKMNELEINE